MNKCEQCDKEYEAKRATSRFCSQACKQASYRNKPVTLSVTVSPEPVTVTSKPLTILQSRERSKEGVARPGDADYPEQTDLNTCNKCGRKLKYDVLDVCGPCVWPKTAQLAPGQEIATG